MSLTTKGQWCEKHWKPFNNKTAGSNGIAASIGLAQVVLNDPEFLKKAPDLKDAVTSQAALESMNPLCCRYDDFLIEFHATTEKMNRGMTMDEVLRFIRKKFGIK